jgi:hypothetical protein
MDSAITVNVKKDGGLGSSTTFSATRMEESDEPSRKSID